MSIQPQKLGKRYSKKVRDSSNLVLLDHQLLKNNCTLSIDKMNSKEIYSIVISSKLNVPTSRIYFEKRFSLYSFHGKDNYRFLPKFTTYIFLSNSCVLFAKSKKRNKSPILLLFSYTGYLK